MKLRDIAEIMESGRKIVLYASIYGIKESIMVYPENLLGQGEPELLEREAVEIGIENGHVFVMVE